MGVAQPRRFVVCGVLLAAVLAGPAAAQSRSRLGALAGRVRDTSGTPLPLVLVTVALATPRTVLTDAAGVFVVDSVPVGVHRVAFRRIGFAPAEFSLLVSSDESPLVVVELAPAPVRLDSISVAARTIFPELQVTGFYERERLAREGAGVGRFITPEEMDHLRTMPKTTHVVETAGVRLLQQEGGGLTLWPVGRANVILRGDLKNILTGPCQMAVFIDGFEVDIGTYWRAPYRPPPVPGGLDAFVHPIDIRAIEIYQSASGTPAQFQSVRNAMCGSIVIWTRAGRDPPRD